MKNERDWNKGINIIQILIGLIGLFFGVVVYLITRSSNQTYFVSEYFLNMNLSIAIPSAFRIIRNNLPDFIHPFAFILITSRLISLDNIKGQLFICMGWFFLESSFELGQWFKEISLGMIPSWFEGIPFFENTNNYFLNGTFDILDILSILLGTITAFYILSITSIRRERK